MDSVVTAGVVTVGVVTDGVAMLGVVIDSVLIVVGDKSMSRINFMGWYGNTIRHRNRRFWIRLPGIYYGGQYYFRGDFRFRKPRWW